MTKKKRQLIKEEQLAILEEKKKQGRLSKAGKWMLKHPNGIGEIIDMRAVMR
jgi:hypothetical protein